MAHKRFALKTLAPVVAAAAALSLVWLPGTGSTHTEDGGKKGVLLASASTLPDNNFREIAVLVSSRRAMRRTWRQFDLEGSPMRMDFRRRRVLFAGTGESGTCPLEYQEIERVEGRRLVHVHVESAWGPDCTDDFRPRTFVIAARKTNFPDGEFEVKTGFGRKVNVRRR